MTNSISIAFVVSNVRPERCGVSDYSIRMVALLSQRCKSVALLALKRDPETTRDVETCEGLVRVLDLNRDNAKQYDVLIVQHVPNNLFIGNDYINKIREINHPRVYLMLHEIWYLSTVDHKIPIFKRFKVFSQKIKLKRILRALKPKKVFTSNSFYHDALSKEKIESEILPIIGTIPVYTNIVLLDQLTLPKWWSNGENRVLWVNFGSLYTSYWDCLKFFESIKDLHLESKIHRWIVCGHQSDIDCQNLSKAASVAGCLDQIHFTGSISAKYIDGLIQKADYSFSGNSQEIWQKSTGILTALERKIPVYLPRNSIWITPFDPRDLIHSSELKTKFTMCSQSFEIADESKYSPDLIVEKLLQLIEF